MIRARIPADERGDLDGLWYALGRFVRLGLVGSTRRAGFPSAYSVLPRLVGIVQALGALRRLPSFPLNKVKPCQPALLAGPASSPSAPGAVLPFPFHAEV